MKNLLALLFACTAMLIAGCSTPPKSAATELQGTWQGEEIGQSGTCFLSVSGNNMEFRGADLREWYKGTFTLREDTNPKQLIGTIADCPDPDYLGRMVYAIYRIENGALTISGNEPGRNEVPAGFDAAGARRFNLKKL